MKESDWRSQLIKQFREKKLGFIWANDVRYKAGYPDLYTIRKGVSIHYELKYHRGEFSELTILDKTMTKLQQAVCKSIAGARGNVYTLVLLENKSVYAYNWFNLRGQLYTPEQFYSWWISS